MNGISLTSSMRNNLLSLQQTARLQDKTQNRLATGLKVNSAIDNPSSYYTAQSLNNRAEDLNILLDAMSQGIQTLKAVSESIEAGTKFLEQAKSVASEAISAPLVEKAEENQIDYTKFTLLDKSWFEAQVGANGAVVSTADELKQAITAGKELIVIYGKINLINENICLTNQKLVGTEYFANINENAFYRTNSKEYFSRITINIDNSAKSGIILGDSSQLSDLEVKHILKRADNTGAVSVRGNNTSIKNVNIHT